MSTRAVHGGRSLPRYLTSFIGRSDEVEEICALLARDDVRLLTLIGPGGAGKTRLAVEAVSRLDEDEWDDIGFIPLVAIRDRALVLPAIAQALGLHQVTGRPVDEAIVHFLGDRRVLLVIDNVEMVTDAAPDLGRILAACPGTTMAVTSRVALHISGEHLVLIHPLETPGSSDLPPDRLHGIESVRLFLERANASGHHLALTRENAPAISRICQRLDGLPLALELAAARCGMLSPVALEALLEQGSDILADGPRDAPARHRSMHDAIGWSYDLLPDHEQAVFRRLSLFSAGFSLEAATAVVDLPIDMLAAISSLVGKSLIVPAGHPTPEPRFTMLETLREYGQQRLRECNEVTETRDRHARWFLEEAIRSEYAWLMPLEEGALRLSRLQADHLNMRDALEWFDHSGDRARALELAGALAALWILCGHADEGRGWLTRLLTPPPRDDAVYVIALATLSWLGNQQGRFEEAFLLAEEGLTRLQSQAEPFLVVRCLVLAGVVAADLGRLDQAITMLEEAKARTLALDGPDWWQNWVIIALVHIGYTALIRGDIDDADARFREAADRQVARGFAPGTSHLYGYMVLTGLGRVARARGDLPRALELFQQSLDFTHRFSGWNVPVVNHSIRVMSLIAGTLAARGQIERAARLFGACDALQERFSYHFAEATSQRLAYGIPPRHDSPASTPASSYVPHNPGDVEKSRHQLHTVPPEIVQRAWDEGRTLSLEAAMEEALAPTVALSPTPDNSSHHTLTPREMEVLRLIAEGHSNRAIAGTLSLSERTVEHHVTHILTKLDLDSRTSAATFAVRKGII